MHVTSSSRIVIHHMQHTLFLKPPHTHAKPQGLTLFFRDPLFTAVLGGLTAGAAQFAAVDRTLIWPHVNETLPEVRLNARHRQQRGVCARPAGVCAHPAAALSTTAYGTRARVRLSIQPSSPLEI